MLIEWFLKGGGGINQTVNITVQSRCFHPGLQAAPSCPSVSQKSPPPSTKQGPPGAQTGQRGTLLPRLESWQVPAFPPEQSVSTHQGPGQPGDGLCPSALPSPHRSLQGRDTAGSPARGWLWMARLIYTQRRVPTYAELSAWVPGSLLGGPLLERTQRKCEEAQP